MRNLLLSIGLVCLLGSSGTVLALDWGESQLNDSSAPTIYAAWEIATDFGKDGADAQKAYIACGDKEYKSSPLPPAPPYSYDELSLEVSTSRYLTVAKRVNISANQFQVSWKLLLVTEDDAKADLTFRCITTDGIPAGSKITLTLTAGDGTTTDITAQTENATQVVTLAPAKNATANITLTLTYEIPLLENCEYALALQPGWNLVGFPFETITDVGGLLDAAGDFAYPVMQLDSTVVRPEELSKGRAYWIYTDKAVTVTVMGTGYAGDTTALPELSSGWNYVTLIAQWNRMTGDRTPTISVDTYMPSQNEILWRWDTETQSFVRLRESPVTVGMGLLVQQ